MKSVLVHKLIAAFAVAETFSKVQFDWKYIAPPIDKIENLADRLLDGGKPEIADLDFHEKTIVEDNQTEFEKLFDVFKSTFEIAIRGVEIDFSIPVVEDASIGDTGSDVDVDNVATGDAPDAPDAPDKDENFHTAGADNFAPAAREEVEAPAPIKKETATKKTIKKP